MAVGMRSELPPGTRLDVDGDYLSLRLEGAEATAGNILVTAPTRVVDSTTGTTAALPDDPARWLRSRPLVRVTRVDHVLVDGRPSVQIDYRLAPPTGTAARVDTVPLFCGIGPAEDKVYPWAPLSCTRISPDVRVRSTFVPVDGRVLLAEASWSREVAGERIPAPLAKVYGQLLADLTFVAR
jgi:hypothetical protein